MNHEVRKQHLVDIGVQPGIRGRLLGGDVTQAKVLVIEWRDAVLEGRKPGKGPPQQPYEERCGPGK